ncbi:MAG: hypothetical protein WD715_10885, partial [Dongiaceae bacterium]
LALLGTFGFIRTSTHMIKAQVSWWPGNVSVGGTHVHHLVWGIFAMMIFGYIGVVHQPDSPWREIVSVLFAIGMGLTLEQVLPQFSRGVGALDCVDEGGTVRGHVTPSGVLMALATEEGRAP